MTKTTRFGPTIMRLRTGKLGYDPVGSPTGPAPEPVDLLQDEDARAWYPVSGSGSTALLQDGTDTPGSSDPINQSITFDDPVTAGSLLVVMLVTRSFNGSGFTAPGDWSLGDPIIANGTNGGSAIIAYKIADGTEGTGPFTFGMGATTQRRIWWAEFSGPNQFVDSAEVDSGGAASSYDIGPASPTVGEATLFIVGAINGSAGSITGVTGYTTIGQGKVDGGINGPSSILAYDSIDPAVGDETATVTQDSGNQRAGDLLVFSDISDPIWVPAPFTIDDDDATYHEITGHTECWRGQLTGSFQVGRARLVIGTETSGSKSYALEGQTLADIDAGTGTEIGSFDFTATGSYTADTIEISIDGADGYEFYRLVGPTENRRIFTVELYAPTAGSGVSDHGDLTGLTDQDHPATAIPITDSAGWFTGTNVETTLAELAAKAIGYQAHGNTGATETFDAATGWHSATLDDNCTFTLTAAPTGTVSSLFLELTQDGTGGRAITLPAAVANKAALEAAQDTTAGSTSFLVLLSRDGGTTWYGGWWGEGSATPALEVTDGVTTVDPTAILTFADAGIAAVTVEDAGSDTATVTVDVTLTDSNVQAVGHYELLMVGSSPPEPLEDGTGTDWLYVWVNG